MGCWRILGAPKVQTGSGDRLKCSCIAPDESLAPSDNVEDWAAWRLHPPLRQGRALLARCKTHCATCPHGQGANISPVYSVVIVTGSSGSPLPEAARGAQPRCSQCLGCGQQHISSTAKLRRSGLFPRIVDSFPD